MSRICVGVDGGGTKTAAVAYVVDDGADLSSGRVVGRGVAGPSNKNSVGEESAVGAFRQAVGSALAAEDLSGGVSISCIVLAMAGVDTEADADFWRKVCGEHYPTAHAGDAFCLSCGYANANIVENDSVAALCSGTDGNLCGIVVISGTGSIGLGAASPDAPKIRVGGMGPLLGDGGNGYSLGVAALAAAVKSSDGRGPQTPLLEMILQKYGLQDVEGLLGLAYGANAKFASWDEVAGLAPLVFEAHDTHNCQVAAGILRQVADEICEIVEAVATRLRMGRAGEPATPVILAGGILASPDSYLSRHVHARLAETLPEGTVQRPTMQPSEAAARLAARLLPT